jgi:hypothetical protein
VKEKGGLPPLSGISTMEREPPSFGFAGLSSNETELKVVADETRN